MFRTRQAPSPTGYLHFGTARTMLFTQLIAKAKSGVWFLRIEDTDRNRLQPDAVGSLLNSMLDLGLIPDEGVTPIPTGTKDDYYSIYSKGEYGPYIQSERLSIYHKYAQQMIDKKLCYWSYVTPTIKEELQTLKQITKKPINYYTVNIQILSSKPVTESSAVLTDSVESKLYQSVEDGLKDPQKPDLKFRIQTDRTLETNDELLGKSKFDLNLEEDFTCLKSDGYPTYHFAHPIDDYLMKTTWNIRSQEWISSLPKHYTLHEGLGFPEPQYMHLPPILGETGNKKMSKRDGNVNMATYLADGFLPEAIVNYLAFLGWNPGTDQELYLTHTDFEINQSESVATQRNNRLSKLYSNLLQDFTVEKLQKSPARFSLDKLIWFNKEYIKMMSPYEYSYLSRKQTNAIKKEGDYRLGDYVFIVDEDKQEVLGGYDNGKPNQVGVDGRFYPVGGGREEGQDALESLLREIKEESNDTIKVSKEELLYMDSLHMPAVGTWSGEDKTFHGKEMNLYYINRSKDDTAEFVNNENGHLFHNTWAPLDLVIGANLQFTYPIYHEFCITNNKKCYPMDLPSKDLILSALLDMPRINKLTDEPLDSRIFNNYSLEDISIIKWKKITLEETIDNLRELKPIIDQALSNHSQAKSELDNLLFTPSIHTHFTKLYHDLETEIKSWLTENNKDFGAYLWGLRVTLSGLERSPSPFELLAILPLSEIERRLSSVIK
jgi:glutamyl-tRNA synthetase